MLGYLHILFGRPGGVVKGFCKFSFCPNACFESQGQSHTLPLVLLKCPDALDLLNAPKILLLAMLHVGLNHKPSLFKSSQQTYSLTGLLRYLGNSIK